MEKRLVEDEVVKRLKAEGWEYVEPEELNKWREDWGPLLTEKLMEFVRKWADEYSKEKGMEVTERDLEMVINELRIVPATVEGAKKILDYIKNGVPIRLEKSGLSVKVPVIDFDRLEKNDFIFSRQVVFRSYGQEIRADVVLFVNGIPLVIIECKGVEEGEGTDEAFKQIKRYSRQVEELFKYLQIGVGVSMVAEYFPVHPRMEGVHRYSWKDKKLREEGVIDPLEHQVRMLLPETLLDIVQNFIFFLKKDGEYRKVLPRYMQYEAANRIYERVRLYHAGEDKRKNGLIWHWQGSGKTFTMICAAYKIKRLLGRASVFFVVDRRELQEQMYENLTAVGINAKKINSVAELKEWILKDEFRGEEGYFVLLMHKFSEDVFKDIAEELKKREDSVYWRDDIVLFIDEGHRTQYGTLASRMRAIFNNAHMFAFTGTPIAKEDRNTFLEFAYPEYNELFLHKYFIKESVSDGYTLDIVIEPRLDIVHLKKEDVEAFLDGLLEEIPEEERTEVHAELRKRFSRIKEFMKNKDRIRKISADIVEHYTGNCMDKGLKALVVAVDREACVFYAEEIVKELQKRFGDRAEEIVNVVITYSQNDSEKIQEYKRYLQERFPGRSEDEINKEIIKKFKYENNPRILVVTSMLLTGFDVPRLGVMYVDKPMKGHTLLQALGRVNRPYTDVKQYGLVVDYTGVLLKNFGRALYYYHEKIGNEYEQILDEIYYLKDYRENVKKELIASIREIEELFAAGGILLESVLSTREVLESAVEYISGDPTREKTFKDKIRKLNKLVLKLGPDPLRADPEFTKKLRAVTAVYSAYLQIVRRDKLEDVIKRDAVLRHVFKILNAVHALIEVEAIKKNYSPIRMSKDIIRKLDERYGADVHAKARDALFELQKFVLVDRGNDPVFKPLSQQVKELIERWNKREEDVEQIYEEIKDVLQRVWDTEEKMQLASNRGIVALGLVLRNHGLDVSDDEIKAILDDLVSEGLLFKNWFEKTSVVFDIEKKLSIFLLKRGVYGEKKDAVLRDMINTLKRYVNGTENN